MWWVDCLTWTHTHKQCTSLPDSLRSVTLSRVQRRQVSSQSNPSLYITDWHITFNERRIFLCQSIPFHCGSHVTEALWVWFVRNDWGEGCQRFKKIYQNKSGRGCTCWGMVSVYLQWWVESTIYSNMEGGETPVICYLPLSQILRDPARGCDHPGPPVWLQTLLHSSDLTHSFLSNCHKASVVIWCACTHDIQRHLVIEKRKTHTHKKTHSRSSWSQVFSKEAALPHAIT